MDCGSWWFDHVGHTYLYVVAVRQNDAGQQSESVEKLVDGTEAWGRLTGLPDAGRLMGEHVAAVKALVDAAFTADKAVLDAAIDALLKNIVQQTDLYAKAVPGFPAEEWRHLFAQHVTATGAYALALAAGDAEDFKKNWNAVLLSRNLLARIWARLCASRGA